MLSRGARAMIVALLLAAVGSSAGASASPGSMMLGTLQRASGRRASEVSTEIQIGPIVAELMVEKYEAPPAWCEFYDFLDAFADVADAICDIAEGNLLPLWNDYLSKIYPIELDNELAATSMEVLTMDRVLGLVAEHEDDLTSSQSEALTNFATEPFDPSRKEWETALDKVVDEARNKATEKIKSLVMLQFERALNATGKIKSRKSLNTAYNLANRVCKGVDVMVSVLELLGAGCQTHMNISVTGTGLYKSQLLDALCMSISWFPEGDPNGGMDEQQCNTNGVDLVLFKTAFPEWFEDVPDGTRACEWVRPSHVLSGDEYGVPVTQEYCGIRKEMLEAVHRNGVCFTAQMMRDKFTEYDYVHIVNEVTHFKFGDNFKPTDTHKCDNVPQLFMPVNIDDMYNHAFATLFDVGEYFNLEVNDVSVNSPALVVDQKGNLIPGRQIPSGGCLDVFLVDSGLKCPTDYFMADMIVSRYRHNDVIHDGMSGGAIAGIVIGALASLCFCALLWSIATSKSSAVAPHNMPKKESPAGLGVQRTPKTNRVTA